MIELGGILRRGFACRRARRGGSAAVCLLAGFLVLFPLFAAPRATAAGEGVSAWLTTGDRGKLLEPQSTFTFGGDATGGLTIDVNEHHRYQQMDGFGAAMTDSSAWLMATKLSASQRAELVNRLFSPSAGIGIGYVRVPVGASDFSLRHYTYDDTCCDLADFSVPADEAHRIPLLVEAKRLNPALELMATPWSAPGWMKTTDSLYQGTLRADYVDDYASYLARFVDAWAARAFRSPA
jgi:glucosylceramidase